MTIRVNNTVITSETELKDRLDLLYTDSASGKSFNGLMELVTNEHTIKMAIHNIKSNTGSKTPGIDGKTIDDYLSWYDVNGSIQSFCDEIREMLRDYRPKPVRRIYVPKQNGKMRPIGIPTMMDRIIQECLRIILEPIVEARFYTNSYGFRPYRDASQAIARIVSLLNENSGNAHWVVEGDIKGYFDNVDHKILLRKLWENGIIDKRIIEIIRRTLQAGVLEDGKITKSDKGTPQGGILSPLLANIYLNDFDWWIARKYAEPKGWSERYQVLGQQQAKLKKMGVKPIHLTRYADDWVIQCNNEVTAQKVLRDCKKYFKHRLKLELAEDKTVITDCREKAFKFLGLLVFQTTSRKKPDGSGGSLCGKAIVDKAKLRVKVNEWKKIFAKVHKTKKPEDLALAFEALNAKIIGWTQYYKMASAKDAFSLLDHLLYKSAKNAVKAVYGTDVAYEDFKIPVNRFDNRTARHKNHSWRAWAVEINEATIGLTFAAITEIDYPRKKNPKENPYTLEGRKLYAMRSGRQQSLDRPPLYDIPTMARKLTGRENELYNLEYLLNREKAYNQCYKKGYYLCQICKDELVEGKRNCHHRNPNLPVNQVNKVRNLIWICTRCHSRITRNEADLDDLNAPIKRKIVKFRRLALGENT